MPRTRNININRRNRRNNTNLRSTIKIEPLDSIPPLPPLQPIPSLPPLQPIPSLPPLQPIPSLPLPLFQPLQPIPSLPSLPLPPLQPLLSIRPLTRTSNPTIPFSTTSDHKPVCLDFILEGLKGEFEKFRKLILKGLSYNMSYLSDIGPMYPYATNASEAYFLSRIKGPDKRLYWKNAANLVYDFFSTQNPHVMFFQEMNDRKRISNTNPYEVTLENGEFKGGYQALLELLNGGPSGIIYSEEIRADPEGSYYVYGSFGNFCFVAYSIKKGGNYPTVLTIWNRLVLGEFENFYGNDIGYHSLYQPDSPYEPNRHLGRPFSCVRTTAQANLINIHGPNWPYYASTKLKLVIERYMEEAKERFGDIWNIKSTVIGGDSNDALNIMSSIDFNDEIYTYIGKKPLTCCAERSDDNLLKPYRHSGDIIFVANPKRPIELYQPSNTSIAYGQYYVKKIRKNKKKKSLKRKPNDRKPNDRKSNQQKKRHTYKQF
jgi:hypothetical protein